jgi:hypothetical protein
LPERPIVTADIRGRKPVLTPAIVSPADFRVGAWDPEVTQGALARFVPYCLDPAERRSCYVDAGGAKALIQAKFQYLHLRERAVRVASVPWERLPLRPASPRRIVYVFSVGRCGSTFLVEALRAGGVMSLSEPDFPTQAVAQHRRNPRPDRGRELSRVLQSMTGDLAAFCFGAEPGPVLIKLRAECCLAPELLLGPGNDRPAVIFLLRDFETWARSMLAVTTLTPARLVERYMQALQCLDWLGRNATTVLLRYEHLLADPSTSIGDAMNQLDVTWNPKRLKPALRRDAQSGTPLARNASSRQPVDEQALAHARALWERRKPVALLAMAGLD